MIALRFARRAACTFHLLAALGSAALAAPPELDGDWPGWIYFEEEGDLPLRLQFVTTDTGLVAKMDAVVQKAFDLPFRKVAWSPPHLDLERVTSSGTVVRLAGTVEEDRFHGHVLWGDAAGEFEFLRSALPIADTDLADAQDIAGHYRLPDGVPAVVTARPWGELVLRFWETGEPRTLFPLGRDVFFVGRALYAADSVEARLRAVRSAGGQVTHLEWSPMHGDFQLARRFEVAEEEVAFVAGGDTLRGAVQRSVEAGSRPGVVIVGGSSWETRDDVRFRAEMLAAMGFVVLSYDRRGFGLSEGERIVPFDRTAKDALAAVEFLRGRPEVAGARAGILGASRGGWIAPLAAAQSPTVSFLMLLVAPAVSPAEQETRSRLDQMRAAGYADPDLEQAGKLLDLTWSFLRTGKGWDEYAAARQAGVEKGYPEYLFESDTPDSAAWAWGRMNMFYDPLPALARVQCPVVAIYGERDIYVSTAVNMPLLVRTLTEAGNSAVTAVVLPGAGHNLGRASNLPIHLSNGVGDEGFMTLWRWSRARFPELP